MDTGFKKATTIDLVVCWQQRKTKLFLLTANYFCVRTSKLLRFLSVTIPVKATEQNFAVMLFITTMLYKVILNYESVLKC